MANQIHHKFPNTKPNKKYYGKGNPVDGIDWINDPRNLMHACSECNQSHKGQKNGAAHGEYNGLPVLREDEFCSMMGIEIRSKVGRGKSMYKEEG